MTTRLIREEARAEPGPPTTRATRPATATVTVAHQPLRTPADLAPLPAPPARLLRPLLPTFAADPPPPDPSLAAQAALTAHWQQDVARLRAAAQEAAASVAAHDLALQRALQSAKEAHAALEALRAQQAELKSMKSAQQAAYDRLQRQHQTVQANLSEIERQVSEAQQASAMASTRYSILPYDGRSGATRRPVVIECTESGLTFASEQISLSARDVDGFTERFNPLLAGAEALIDYWGDRANPQEPRPYVLLVVRPGGIVAYYVARQLLEKLSEPFGYELVPADHQFEWPETNAGAVRVCQEAIDELLQERNQLRRAVAGARVPGTQQFVSGDGGFHLPEVERLRRSGREVTFNGRQWSREPLTSMGTSRDGGSDGLPEAANDRQQASRATEDPRFRLRNTGRAADGGGANDHERDERNATGTFEITPAAPDRFTPAENMSEIPQRSGVVGSPRGADPSMTNSRPPGTTKDLDEALARMMPRFGGQTSTGRSSSNPLEDGPGQRSARKSRIDPKAPQWGVQNPQAGIGFEREITVQVMPGRVTVADETTFPIELGAAAEDLQRLLAVHLDAHVTSWGPPPQSFFWVPAVRFVVSPGGNQYHRRLEALTKQWGLRSSAEYALE